MLEVDAWLSIGLYYIDLWELERGIEAFTRVIEIAAGTSHDRWSKKATVGLAFVYSCLGQPETAQVHINRIETAIQADTRGDYAGRFAYFLQLLGKTHTNLGNLNKARQYYQQAIDFSRSSHFLQIEARAIAGVARLERCQEKYDRAREYHQKPIAIFQKIGAICDLADAYYEYGSSARAAGNFSQAQQHWQQSLQLYRQIDAPRQIEKIRSRIKSKERSQELAR